MSTTDVIVPPKGDYSTVNGIAAHGGHAVHDSRAISIFAFAFGSLGHHGNLTFAIIAIGLAVATAHRPVDSRSDFGHACADARHVDDTAASGFLLAEGAGVALDAGETAADLSDADRLNTGRGQGDHRNDRREGQNRFDLHAFLPILLDACRNTTLGYIEVDRGTTAEGREAWPRDGLNEPIHRRMPEAV
jgi:hypothetical protein